MRGLAAVILVSSVCTASLLAQERDRSLERIGLALQQPSPIVRGVAPVDSASPRQLGIFTLVPPASRGEMIRISIPIGEFITRAVRGVAGANQRRQEAAARRRVEAALEAFARAR
jgi:hypothetical protein